MKWTELEAWAERNGFRVGARNFEGFSALAEIAFEEDAPGEERLCYWRESLSAAKRALCRAVERLREAK